MRTGYEKLLHFILFHRYYKYTYKSQHDFTKKIWTPRSFTQVPLKLVVLSSAQNIDKQQFETRSALEKKTTREQNKIPVLFHTAAGQA